ncbi:MAG TPA: acyl-CoA dehydrogenase [bacterium]
MDFKLSDEHRMIQEMVGNFANKEVAPIAERLDAEELFPSDNVKKMAEMGLLGMCIPAEYGGAGFDVISYVIAMEEISRVCASTGVIMSVNNSLVCDPIYKFGTEEQKQEYLVPLAKGERLGCFCLSEPGTGSDAAAQKTTCRKSGDEWILNGTKNFITNGPQAHIAIIFAIADRSKGYKGINTFIVERDTPGYSIGKVEQKLGIRGSGTSQIILEDCRVSEANLLGGECGGFKVAMTALDSGRIGIAAQALGIARGAYEEALSYARQREAFGQQIAEFQGIQWMLADMAVRIDAAKLLVWRAAMLKQAGQRFTKEAAMAKLFASETAMWVVTKAVQVHGGYGFIKDYRVERFFRDAKITEIYEGTSEIQRNIIAREILK